MKKRKYARYLTYIGRRSRWNKKGQFFLVAALVTIMILFTLTVKYNTIKQVVALEDFKELSETYATEQPKVINLAIQEGLPADEQVTRLREFTQRYQNYAQQREPSFGIFYAYRDQEGNIHLVNSLRGTVINIQFTSVSGKDATIQLIPGEEPAPGTVALEIGGQKIGTTVSTGISSYGKALSETQLAAISEIHIVVPGPRGTKTISLFGPGVECWGKPTSGPEREDPCSAIYASAQTEEGFELERGVIKATLTVT